MAIQFCDSERRVVWPLVTGELAHINVKLLQYIKMQDRISMDPNEKLDVPLTVYMRDDLCYPPTY